MIYRGTITIDFTGPNGNEYNKLSVALTQAGWIRIETSLFIIESEELPVVWVGVELVAKQAASIGVLSALTFHVQGSVHWGGQAIAAAPNHPNAMGEILQKPLPTESFSR
jgi:hypothetical protein